MLRRTIALLGCTAVLALAAPTAASAAPPPLGSYAAGSSSTALVLTLLGQEIAVSDTSAAISSTPEAAADGAALLVAGTPVPGAAPSAAPAGPASNEVCAAELDLDEATGNALSLLGLGLACVETNAVVADGAPAAQSASGELVITLTSPAGALLEPILTPLFDTVPQITDPLLDALAPILGPITDVTGIDLPQILDDLLDNLQNDTFVLAEIVVAPTVSQASADATDGVVARAGANGVTINLLPGLASTLADLGLGITPSEAPLLSVKLGSAVAEVVRDPATGAADASASAAQLLSIEANDELGILAELTGQLTGVINGLAIDQLGCTGANPLADVLCVDLGAVHELSDAELLARGFDFGEGTVGRAASAANIQLLPIAADVLGGSVLGIRLGAADAAANGTVAQLPSAPTPEPAPPAARGPLPRTGAEDALPLTLGLLATAGAGLFLVRRTRNV